jgi:hypothetical protein
VLRRPRGTLFGKNVIGGAISLYTKRHSRDFEANAGKNRTGWPMISTRCL